MWLQSVCFSVIPGFLSVAVITCASHAQGRRFEPGRKQIYFFHIYSKQHFSSANMFLIILVK